jgi:hypothetical protein
VFRAVALGTLYPDAEDVSVSRKLPMKPDLPVPAEYSGKLHERMPRADRAHRAGRHIRPRSSDEGNVFEVLPEVDFGFQSPNPVLPYCLPGTVQVISRCTGHCHGANFRERISFSLPPEIKILAQKAKRPGRLSRRGDLGLHPGTPLGYQRPVMLVCHVYHEIVGIPDACCLLVVRLLLRGRRVSAVPV